MKVNFADVQSRAGGDLPTVCAIVTYAGLAAQGEPLRSMQNRSTLILRSRGHVAHRHEHTSAPVGFEDYKVILER